MTTSIKVPKEIQELFWESDACRELAKAHDEGILPSLKAIYYASKAGRARTLAWRAMKAAHAEVNHYTWHYDDLLGVITKMEAPGEYKTVKKPRKPRAAKAETPVVNQGEKQ